MAIVSRVKSKLKMRFVDGFKMEEGAHRSGWGPALTNADLEPVPLANRNWNWKTYASYWLSESWGATAVSVGAAMVASGLTWWQAIVACAIAHVIGAVLTVINCVSQLLSASHRRNTTLT
jgi:NCS1 family nucleobase:cation symporter-1